MPPDLDRVAAVPAVFDEAGFGEAVFDAVVRDAVDDARVEGLAAGVEERVEADRPDEPVRDEVPRVGTLDRPAMGRGYP